LVFTLWGAKIASLIGLPIEQAAFWNWPGPATCAQTFGAFGYKQPDGFCDDCGCWDFAASLSGAFGKASWPNAPQLFAAAIGGILMGIGARLGFGCNIGAFLAGTASGSVHGWIWFAMAMAGSVLGIRLRAVFGF
jgi:hypothetical protein